jgi:hypothetical protein
MNGSILEYCYMRGLVFFKYREYCLLFFLLRTCDSCSSYLVFLVCYEFLVVAELVLGV